MPDIYASRLIEAHQVMMEVYHLPEGTPLTYDLQYRCMQAAVAIKVAIGTLIVPIVDDTPKPPTGSL